MKPTWNPKYLAWIRTLPCLVCGRTKGSKPLTRTTGHGAEIARHFRCPIVHRITGQALTLTISWEPAPLSGAWARYSGCRRASQCQAVDSIEDGVFVASGGEDYAWSRPDRITVGYSARLWRRRRKIEVGAQKETVDPIIREFIRFGLRAMLGMELCSNWNRWAAPAT
jgi:hypothetical protein